MPTALRLPAALALLSLVAACGSGANSVGPAASTDRYALDAAMARLLAEGFSAGVSVSGNVNGLPVTGEGSLSVSKAGDASLDGATRLLSASLSDLTVNLDGRASALHSSGGSYFTRSGYRPAGEIDADGSFYAVTATDAWPALARVGDSGLVARLQRQGTTTGNAADTVEISYAIEADAAHSVIVDMVTTQSRAGSTLTAEHMRYRLTSAGEISFVSALANYPGFGQLTLKPTTLAAGPAAPANPADPLAGATTAASVTFQIDVAHSGHSELGKLPVFPQTPAWQVDFDNTLSYPLIAGGRVFVLVAGNSADNRWNYGARLYALDAATGARLWGPRTIGGSYQAARLAYDDGRVFTTNHDGTMRAFDAATGREDWSVQLPGQYAFSAPPAAHDGLVFTGGAGSGGTLYAVRQASGEIAWTRPVANGDGSGPALADGLVYVSYPCQVYAFAQTTGEPRWNTSEGCSGGGGMTPVHANGQLLVRDWTTTDALRTYDAGTGSLLSTIARTGFSSRSTIPAATASRLVRLDAGTLRVIDRVTGSQLWSRVGTGDWVSAPLILNGTVIIGGSNGQVSALDLDTGDTRWTGSTGSTITAPDEWNAAMLTGFGAGADLLVVPADSRLVAWRIALPTTAGKIGALRLAQR